MLHMVSFSMRGMMILGGPMGDINCLIVVSYWIINTHFRFLMFSPAVQMYLEVVIFLLEQFFFGRIVAWVMDTMVS
jgi:hypothetical protein